MLCGATSLTARCEFAYSPRLVNAPGLTRIPGDTQNRHFNEEVCFYKADCWLYSVWSLLASRVQVDVRASTIDFQTGGDLPSFDNKPTVSLFSWPCPTDGWQPYADQSLPSWDSKASVHTSQRKERERRDGKREGVCGRQQCVNCDFSP